MGFLDEVFCSIGMSSPGDTLDAFSGRTGAEAALEGARAQTELGREGLRLEREAQERLRGTLSPFVNLGAGLTGRAGGLFDSAESVLSDPAFQSAADKQELLTLIGQANRGRLSTGETGESLVSGLSRLGSDFLSRQRGDLLSPIQIGQASAAQEASSGLASGQRRGDLLSQIGAAQAAGGIGAAQSFGQGAQNIGTAVAGIASFFSDDRLKEDVASHGEYNGHKTYKYRYKGGDTEYIGVMASEVKSKKPEAVQTINGYDYVDYGLL
jgi:hypothetical protein